MNEAAGAYTDLIDSRVAGYVPFRCNNNKARLDANASGSETAEAQRQKPQKSEEAVFDKHFLRIDRPDALTEFARSRLGRDVADLAEAVRLCARRTGGSLISTRLA